MKEYDIGGKKFTQAKLVLRKLKLLLSLIKGFDYAKDLSIIGLINLLNPVISDVMAILLTSTEVKSEDTRDFLEDNMTIEDIVKVIEDFLVLNPLIELVKKIKG